MTKIDVMHDILVDSAFVFALFNEKDNFHKKAIQNEYHLKDNHIHRIIFPWPIFYETVNRQLVNNEKAARRFNEMIKRPGVVRLDDSKYRDQALKDTLDRAARRHRGGETGTRSLVDSVLHAILESERKRIYAMLTFDERDFNWICAKLGVRTIF